MASMQAYFHQTHLQSLDATKPSSNIPASPRADERRPSISRARSASALSEMAALQPSVVLTESQPQTSSPENNFRTIADPRNSSTTDLTRRPSDTSKHPELNEEVASLSDKLIRAINHQTSLDDTLSQTKFALEASRTRIAKLEQEARDYEQKIAEERQQKATVAAEKKKLEQEVENLTASLFDEANKLVASANREKSAIEKRNQILRDQVRDNEALMAFQIEQLAELKNILHQQMGNEPRRTDSPRLPEAPESPALAKGETDLTRLLEAMHLSPVTPDSAQIVPIPATSLSHLIKPVCRTDIPAYEDFRNLVQTSGYRSQSTSKAPSRAGSGSYGGLNLQGLGLTTPSIITPSSQPGSAKMTSPNQPSTIYSPNLEARTPMALKDTRFFKRIMAEDVEPTLRLDLSPTISWLNRRSITSALCEGSLIVEPIPEMSYKMYGRLTPCAICGENRKQEENPRTHAMRMRDGEGAPRWSICQLCLTKVRGVGDLVTYVRMVREGVVKCNDVKEEEETWEELVRLRERLFWARMAGGVVPSFLPSTKTSPVASVVPAPSSPGNGSPKDPTPSTPNGKPHDIDDGDVNGSPGGTDREETEDEKEARMQLQRALDDSLTTFDKIRQQSVANQGGSPRLNNDLASPADQAPATPPRGKRESGGFPKITIPRLPSGFSPISGSK